jgi:hypothetical protein
VVVLPVRVAAVLPGEGVNTGVGSDALYATMGRDGECEGEARQGEARKYI